MLQYIPNDASDGCSQREGMLTSKVARDIKCMIHIWDLGYLNINTSRRWLAGGPLWRGGAVFMEPGRGAHTRGETETGAWCWCCCNTELRMRRSRTRRRRRGSAEEGGGHAARCWSSRQTPPQRTCPPSRPSFCPPYFPFTPLSTQATRKQRESRWLQRHGSRGGKPLFFFI